MPDQTRQAVTPAPLGAVAGLPPRNAPDVSQTLLPAARAWLDDAKHRLLSGTYGPAIDKGMCALEGMSPPGAYSDPQGNQIWRVLQAANWKARLYESNPMIGRDKERFTPVANRPFGYDFPTPDQVNDAIYAAQGRELLRCATSGSDFPTGSEVSAIALQDQATAMAVADGYIRRLGNALRDDRIRRGSDGWYSPASIALYPPKEMLTVGSAQHQRLLAALGTSWEVRVRSQWECADGTQYYLELRPR